MIRQLAVLALATLASRAVLPEPCAMCDDPQAVSVILVLSAASLREGCAECARSRNDPPWTKLWRIFHGRERIRFETWFPDGRTRDRWGTLYASDRVVLSRLEALDRDLLVVCKGGVEKCRWSGPVDMSAYRMLFATIANELGRQGTNRPDGTGGSAL